MEQALKRNAWYALYICPFLEVLSQFCGGDLYRRDDHNSATRTGLHDTFAVGDQVIKTSDLLDPFLARRTRTPVRVLRRQTINPRSVRPSQALGLLLVRHCFDEFVEVAF